MTTLYSLAHDQGWAVGILFTLIYLYKASHDWAWPRLLDMGLLLLYLWRPSLPLLALIVLLLLVRHSPTLSCLVARLLGADQFEGWTVNALVFCLPGLQVYAGGSPQALPAQALPPAVTGATTALPPLPPAQRQPMGPVAWLAAVNTDPASPHLGIIGPTQHGKTTFCMALLSRRLGQVIIASPKNDQWAGAQVLRPRIDLERAQIDWAPVTTAIRHVHFEMLRRNAQHDTQAQPLTLVVDEYTTTLANIPAAARSQMLEVWSMGASCGIRSIVIAQEANATAWGIQGRRDILSNLLFAQVSPGYSWAIGRIDPNGRLIDPQALSTQGLLTLAAEAVLRGREWAPECPPEAPSVPQAHIPTQALPQAPESPEAGSGPASGAGGGGGGSAPGGQTSGREGRLRMYTQWRAEGVTEAQARALRQAAGGGLDNTEWAEAGRRLRA